jgi:hypothetical protein
MIIRIMREQMMVMKRNISFCKVVIPTTGLLVNLAIRPKTVLSPVATHTPRPLPDIQCVPWRPMQRVSR